MHAEPLLTGLKSGLFLYFAEGEQLSLFTPHSVFSSFDVTF